MTTYNPNIPQPGDLISNSQPQILGNFDQLNTQFGIDHVAFNTGSGNGTGYHKVISIPVVQGSAPALPSGASPGIMYTKTAQGASQLFWRNANDEQQITQEVPLRASIVFTGATGVHLGTPFNANDATIGGGNQYTWTMPTPPPSVNYYYNISFVTANGASRVTINSKLSNGLVFQFFNTGTTPVLPAEVCIMVWGG